jgi:hypothetical protein
MRWAWLAGVVLALVVAPAARAQYVFLQYTMQFKKPQANQPGSNPNAPPPNPQAPPGSANAADAEMIEIPVMGVVEVKDYRELPNFAAQRMKATVKTPWGVSTLYNDNLLITRFLPANALPNVRVRYTAKRDALNRQRTPEKIYDLAEWCLNHGLVAEFAALMDEAASAGKKTNLDKLDRAVEAYTQVKDGLANKLEREDAAAYWRSRLGFRVSTSDHYALLYNAALNNPPEVEQRLKALEDNLRAVCLWFALKGVALNLPDQKLVAVLLDQPDQFTIQRALIEDEPLVSDGFFSPRDNVVVFSAQRLDDASVRFAKQMQGFYQQGWDRDALLKGSTTSRLAGKSADQKERMSTLALLDKAMEVEAERAAVSHEGTRQLFVGAGLQKPTVVMPEWFQFGMASVFETPKGPFPGAPVEVRVAFWPGYGAPSWKYTRLFHRFHEETPKDASIISFQQRAALGPAGATLREVVTGSEFGQARDLERVGGPVAAMVPLLRARSYAWALCYYLTRQRTQGIIRFYDELSRMPRDLDPEPLDVLACFCRAFDVADTTGQKMDPVKFEELAKDWLGYMKTVRPPGAELNLGVPQGQPGQPGSLPGGPQPKGGNPPKGGP